MLVGRQPERARIDDLLEQARRGRSGTLLLRGEPGIGKTSLLSYAAGAADGMTVVRTQGVESEASLAFAGLHDVCRPLLGHLEALPPLQAQALRAAFGFERGDSSDRLATGAGALGLLAAAAESAPVLVLVDDAQWVDDASIEALLFAARRLHADAVAVLLAVRDGEGSDLVVSGVEELNVTGLTRNDAAALFAGLDVSPTIAEHLYAVTRGNPLGLVELPAALTPGQLAGDEPIEDPFPVNLRIERAFAARLAKLDEPDQRALGIAAASSSGDSAAVASAIAAANLDPVALERAEDAGLVRLTRQEIQFRHPLVRSAVHQRSSPSERRRAHELLARAFAERGDVDRSALHRAAAAFGPDNDVAAGLEELAQRSRLRGAPGAAARAFERAAELSADRAARTRRIAEAAEAFWAAGQTRRAVELLDEGIRGVDDPNVRGRMLALRGAIEHHSGASSRAVQVLLEAADLIESEDPDTALVALADAFSAAFQSGDLATCGHAAARITILAPSAADGEFYGALIPGIHALCRGANDDAEALLERAVALVETGAGPSLERHAHWMARGAGWLDRFAQARELVAHAIVKLRDQSRIGALSEALWAKASHDMHLGNIEEARAGATEALALARHAGQDVDATFAHSILAWLEAIRGNADDCAQHAGVTIRQSETFGRLGFRLMAERSLGLLALGEGRLEEAVDRLGHARRAADAHDLSRLFVPLTADLVEALVRTDRLAEAKAVVDRIPEPFVPNERALVARARAYVAEEDFEIHFATALEAHAEGQEAFEQARTWLCFGERLRRVGRRQEARAALRRAVSAFERLQARPWTQRAAAELAATGERYRRRDATTTEPLTPQELQVALQVGEGKTNRDAAAALFLSPKTVEFHLTRVYRKLDVRSRAELIRLLSADEQREALAAATPSRVA